jgi:hypothetical protein
MDSFGIAVRRLALEPASSGLGTMRQQVGGHASHGERREMEDAELGALRSLLLVRGTSIRCLFCPVGLFSIVHSSSLCSSVLPADSSVPKPKLYLKELP